MIQFFLSLARAGVEPLLLTLSHHDMFVVMTGVVSQTCLMAVMTNIFHVFVATLLARTLLLDWVVVLVPLGLADSREGMVNAFAVQLAHIPAFHSFLMSNECGISASPLDLHYSRMSGFKVITPLWLTKSLRSFLYKSVYSCALFLIS